MAPTAAEVQVGSGARMAWAHVTYGSQVLCTQVTNGICNTRQSAPQLFLEETADSSINGFKFVIARILNTQIIEGQNIENKILGTYKISKWQNNGVTKYLMQNIEKKLSR